MHRNSLGALVNEEEAAFPDDKNVIAAEDDLVKVKCVAIEFSIPRDDALRRSVIEDGIDSPIPKHPGRT